jgi:TldD protein
VVQHAVDAAKRSGAQYADARVTHTHFQRYWIDATNPWMWERVGVGVRALVNGYWGFAACPSADIADVEDLAREAVAQATVNADSAVPRTVTLDQRPPVTGTWTTPMRIDPFTVPLEEIQAFLDYWGVCVDRAAQRSRIPFALSIADRYVDFARQEGVVATSDGSLFTQTIVESGGFIATEAIANSGLVLSVQHIAKAGLGWELLLDAKIPEQIVTWPAQAEALAQLGATKVPASVGRYTVVCDGATMAAVLQATLGVATQLDRALGYEANASGTSFVNDPLAMLGTFPVASPLVTITANRSATAQLATTQWDAEGVVPRETVLVKNGILTDFQTTREQAAWLAPYYATVHQPVASNGYAASEDALNIPMQHMPNLSLEPAAAAVRLDDLVANVASGILIECGSVVHIDAQARTGLILADRCRKIQNGRVGPLLFGGVVSFNTLEFWKNVTAVGGAATRMTVPFSQYPIGGREAQYYGLSAVAKGQPSQMASHSVQAVAATVTNQAVIDPMRKA